MSENFKNPTALLIDDLVKLDVIDVSGEQCVLILFNNIDDAQEVESVICTKSELDASFLVALKEPSGQGFSLSLYLRDRNVRYTLADSLATLNQHGKIDETATYFECSRLISEWSKYVQDFLLENLELEPVHPVSISMADDSEGGANNGFNDLSDDLSDVFLSDDAQQVDFNIKQSLARTSCRTAEFGFIVIAIALSLLSIVLLFYTIKTQNDFNANWRELLSVKSTAQDINLDNDQYIDDYFYVLPENAQESDQLVINSAVESTKSKARLQDKAGEIQAAIDKHFNNAYKKKQLGRCGALDDDCEAETVVLKSEVILNDKTIDLLLKMAAFYALPIGDLHKEGNEPYLVFATIDDQEWLEELKATEQLGYTAMFFPVMESGEKNDEQMVSELERLSLAYCLRDVAYASGDVLSEEDDAQLNVYRNSPAVQSCEWEDSLFAANDLWQLLQVELEDLKVAPQAPIIVNLNGEIISKKGLKEASAASLADWLKLK